LGNQSILNFLQPELTSHIELERSPEENPPRFNRLQKANDNLQVKLKEIEDKNVYLEAYSKRKNIIFENILQATGKEDTESLLCTFLEFKLG